MCVTDITLFPKKTGDNNDNDDDEEEEVKSSKVTKKKFISIHEIRKQLSESIWAYHIK